MKKKISVIISDLSLKKKRLLKPDIKYNWYVSPQWSTDGHKLAFIGITVKQKGKDLLCDAALFVADENGDNIKLVRSEYDIPQWKAPNLIFKRYI